jgi:hypothetical protein
MGRAVVEGGLTTCRGSSLPADQVPRTTQDAFLLRMRRSAPGGDWIGCGRPSVAAVRWLVRWRREAELGGASGRCSG